MAIGVLVEALLPGSGGVVVGVWWEVSLPLKMKRMQKNGSGTNLKPWRCYQGD